MSINIEGLDKAEVFMALYNNAKLTATRWFKPEESPDMTKESAKIMVEKTPSLSFDYVNGRVMKVNISKDSFDPWLYDRDNGEGSAEKAVNGIR